LYPLWATFRCAGAAIVPRISGGAIALRSTGTHPRRSMIVTACDCSVGRGSPSAQAVSTRVAGSPRTANISCAAAAKESASPAVSVRSMARTPARSQSMSVEPR
jgi:hypothetical protein